MNIDNPKVREQMDAWLAKNATPTGNKAGDAINAIVNLVLKMAAENVLIRGIECSDCGEHSEGLDPDDLAAIIDHTITEHRTPASAEIQMTSHLYSGTELAMLIGAEPSSEYERARRARADFWSHLTDSYTK